MVTIRWILGFIQATKGSTRTHDVIFTNGLKERNDSVCRALDWGLLNQDSHLNHSVMSLGVALFLLLSNRSIDQSKKTEMAISWRADDGPLSGILGYSLP